jgi:hypothetical protein
MDMNSELSDPILNAVSTRWEKAFVTDLRANLGKLKASSKANLRAVSPLFFFLFLFAEGKSLKSEHATRLVTTHALGS